MNMNQSCTSGFFGPGELSRMENIHQPTILSSSGDSPFVLYKYVRDGRIVVLKAISEKFRDSFLHEEILRKEYEIGKSLSNHPNIREYYAFSDIPGIGKCIEMEWIDGSTLEEILPECRKDSELCDRIASQLISAIKFIHLKQVVHRDLKPANILITKNGQNVKLIDFSLSDSDSYCVLKGCAGTASYAAPEQISCTASDYRSDIYSLGVILSEMSDRRKYRKVSAKCTRVEADRRYRDVGQLEKSLFRVSYSVVTMVTAAVLVVSAAAISYAINKNEDKQDYVDQDTIDEIFQHATELLEDTNT